MKTAPAALAMVKLLRQTASLAVSLPQTETVLLSLERLDPASAELYRLLRLQNQLLLQRRRSLQASRVLSENLPTMSLIQLELQSLNQLAQVHCQVVGWLAGGGQNDAPRFDPPDSGAPPVPASVDFD